MNRHISKIQKIKIMCAAYTLLFLSFSTSNSFSSTSPVISSEQLKNNNNKELEEKSDWSGSKLSLGYSSSMHKKDDPNHSSSIDSSLLMNYKIDKIFSLSFMQDLSYSLSSPDGNSPQLRDYSRFSNENAFLGISEKIYSSKDEVFSFSLGQGVVIPTNENERKNSELLLGTSFSAPIGVSFDKIGIPGMSLAYSPSFTKFYHKYTHSISGKPLTSYSLTHKFSLGYKLNDSWSFAYGLKVFQRWTYDNYQRDPGYLHLIDIDYNINKNIAFEFELSSSGDMDKSEELNSSYSVYDEDEAKVSLSLIYSF